MPTMAISLFLVIFFHLSSLSSHVSAESPAERAALIAFRAATSGIDGWDESTSACHWPGVLCGGGPAAPVTELNLSGHNLAGTLSPRLSELLSLSKLDLSENNLVGPIPSELGRLRSLKKLSLRFNQLSGSIPPELGSLSNLDYLQLSSNKLSGGIPASLGDLFSLINLDLSKNSLSGSIPATLGRLSNLSNIYLFMNRLSGGIPPQLGNLSSLTSLILYANQLEGEIPEEIGNARNLVTIDVYDNRLSGQIPSSLFNLPHLEVLQLGFNRLEGRLPVELGKNLPSLKALQLFGNRLEGGIPASVGDLNLLEYLELAMNRLSGVLPVELGKLRSLIAVDLSSNGLEADTQEDWGFITSMANCGNLQKLELQDNRLGGDLPSAIANLSKSLTTLRMDRNGIRGTIPAGIGTLVNLQTLSLGGNKLTGEIPEEVGLLRSLGGLNLQDNELTGEIPLSLGRLTGLVKLSLAGNRLRGSIPATLGRLERLTALNLSSNILSGEIPGEIFSLFSLSSFLDLAENNLTGPLWPSIGGLKNLNALNLSQNSLSGEIPTTIIGCQVLQALSLKDNQFSGEIPSAIGDLSGLQELDLSGNKLTGQVPASLSKLNLRELNLSYNDFTGRAPTFENGTLASLVGNPGLCSDQTVVGLRPCRPRRLSPAIWAAVGCGCAVSFAVLLCWVVKRKGSSSTAPAAGDFTYEELKRCTGGFSEENVIGRGAHGCVYRGRLCKDKQAVAVKVIQQGSAAATRSFTAEFEALRSVRHRNLVKILGFLSGNEFMALVYELLPNGSLDQWLHPQDLGKNESLGLMERLDIAIDVASALEYLHQGIEVPIVHGDLKPGNILLDEEMNARVGDFGMARFVPTGSSPCGTTRTVGLKGTIGYVAPEVGTLGKASTASDVYSFGVLLLEMFTGRKPTDPGFTGDLTLRSFVAMGIPRRVLCITDPKLELQPGVVKGEIEEEALIRCLMSVFKLGLLCSEEYEKDRPRISEAARVLTLTRDALHLLSVPHCRNRSTLQIDLER